MNWFQHVLCFFQYFIDCEQRPHWADALNAVSTMLISISAFYIAFRQWRLERQRAALEKYDYRMKIYDKIEDSFQKSRNKQMSIGEAFSLTKLAKEADFFFSMKLSKLIIEYFTIVSIIAVNFQGLEDDLEKSGEKKSNEETLSIQDLIEILTDSYRKIVLLMNEEINKP
jgi:hypothetical protein